LKQVKVLALMDHDTMAGVPLALKAAQEHRIRLIPGVEISAKFGSRWTWITPYFWFLIYQFIFSALTLQQQMWEGLNSRILASEAAFFITSSPMLGWMLVNHCFKS
jgi:hypothetical protein